MSVHGSRNSALVPVAKAAPTTSSVADVMSGPRHQVAAAAFAAADDRRTTEGFIDPSDRDGDLEARNQDGVVSFDDESLILVDECDREIGYLSKAETHRGRGRLHRAFSLFVFDERGRLLMQRRATSKRLWPNYWSNTCCSHPRRGEAIDEAIHRRLHEELGLRCSLEFVFKFQYQAQFDEAGAEHELCWVFEGCSNDPPLPNAREIADIRYIEAAALDLEMSRHPHTFTPWFKQEWARMRRMRHLRA